MLSQPKGATPLGGRRSSLLLRISRIVGSGVAGGVIVSLLGVAAHNFAVGEHWLIQDVSISGNDKASSHQLRHLSDIRLSSHLFTVDLDRAVRGVERHPWVRKAEARKRFPDTVEIVIEEHQPVLLLAVDTLWYVNDQGLPFRQANSDHLDYPVLTGVSEDLVANHPQVARAIVQNAILILTETVSRDAVQTHAVSEIHFGRQTGFDIVLRNGTQVAFGLQTPADGFARLDRLVDVGLDLDVPQRIDLNGEHVAIATPLSNPT